MAFIDGCTRDWWRLPIPDGPFTVGIDGGFVRARGKHGHFEVIIVKSILAFGKAAQSRRRVLHVANNHRFIPSYGERLRRGERVATGFVESKVDKMVSKRMVKCRQTQ